MNQDRQGPELVPSADVLVVGLGLAGACVSWTAIQAGLSVCVADPGSEADSASRVAGGVLDLVSGQKLTPAWRGMEFFRAARSLYQAWQAQLGVEFYREAPILRSFASSDQAALWQTRAQDFERAGIRVRPVGPGELPMGLRAEHGAAWSEPGAWIQTERLLDAWRTELERRGAWVAQTVAPADLGWEGGLWHWRGGSFRHLVLCTGAALAAWPGLEAQPWGRTAGEVLDLELGGLAGEHVAKRKFQLIPMGAGRFRWGGTYRNRPSDCQPSASGRAQLEAGLSDLLAGCEAGPGDRVPELRAHRAAYRGNLRDHLPLVGRLPSQEGRTAWVLGALGSKGALWAPRCAELLLEQLQGQGDLSELHGLLGCRLTRQVADG